MLRRYLRTILVCVLLMTLVTGPLSGIALAAQASGISLSTGSFTLAPGKTKILSVTLKPKSASDTVTFKSNNEGVATVSDKGVVTAVKNGKARITATTSNGLTATATVTVKTVAVRSISLNLKKAELSPLKTLQLKATIKPSNATDKTIAWKSIDETIATVSSTGQVLAHRLGSTTIVATAANGKRASLTLTVKHIPIKSIKLNKTKATVAVNETFKLTATASPGTAYNKEVSWSSSSSTIASVDQNGTVTVHRAGNAVITATAKDGSKKKASCKLTCKSFPVTSISISPGSKILNIGQSAQFSVDFKPANATDKTISSWGVLDSSIASIDQKGKVTAKKAGTTKIYAISNNGNKRAEATIRVPSGKTTRITISAVGDIILGGDPKRGTEKKFAEYLAQRNNDYYEMVKYVSPTLAKDDLTIGNLECALTTYKSHDPKKKYVFRGKPEYAKILTASSIEVVNLSNNHTLDYKSSGYEQTRKALKSAGVAYNGINGAEPLVLTKHGIKIGFIGFNSSLASLGTMQSRLKPLRDTCDVVVVSVHWTNFSEHVYTVQAGQKKIAHGLIDAGADLVIGTHRHVLSGIERYNGKHILYDMGNFMVVGTQSDQDSFIFRQHFDVDTGIADSAGIEVIPIKVSTDPAVNNIQPTTVSDSEASRILDKIRQYSSGLGRADF